MNCEGCWDCCCKTDNLFLSMTENDFKVLETFARKHSAIIKYQQFGSIYLVEKCPAYDRNRGRCLIHQNRPLTCRQFPLIAKETPFGVELGFTTACVKVNQLKEQYAVSPESDSEADDLQNEGDVQINLPRDINQMLEIDQDEYNEMVTAPLNSRKRGRQRKKRPRVQL